MRTVHVLAIFLSLPSMAFGATHPDWPSYMRANRYKCPGPLDTLAKARALDIQGKSYRLSGYRMEISEGDNDNRIAIGVLGSIKSVSDNTQQNLDEALSWFRSEGVEWVVANGDLAIEEDDLERVLDTLGRNGAPTLLTLGNRESRSVFSRVYRSRAKQFPNLINGTWVRQVVADDVEFWTLPGYYAKDFVYQGAGCRYTDDDVRGLDRELVPAGSSPVVLVSHGPPRGRGPRSIDVVTDDSNVGDKAMTSLLVRAKIPFGLFGHILESGGRAVERDLATPVEPESPSPTLYVNAGSVSGDPWGMNDGSISHGMAMIVVIDEGKATYRVKRFERRL